jgi:hypothetical protein
MTIGDSIRDESGFTIQELLVVLIVSTLVVGYCFTLFEFTQKLIISWQRKTELNLAVDRTLHWIILDVEESTQIISVSDSTLVLLSRNGREVAYHGSCGMVFRNDDSLTPPEGIRLSLAFSKSVNDMNTSKRQNVRIAIVGISGSKTYRSSTEMVVPESGRETFIRTSTTLLE